MRYTVIRRNLDGTGPRPVRRYAMTPHPDYWPAVTDVACPCCPGQVRWHEAGYVPGYRICDQCGRHWRADGNSDSPALLRVGQRRSRP